MFKRIMVAIDGSSTSGQALQDAITLGKALQSQLRIVYVVDEVTLNWPEGGDFLAVTEAFRDSGRQILEKAEAQARDAGLTTETKLLEIKTLGHRVAEMIVDEAASWPADLIIIGSHGRRGVNRLLLGSVAEAVTRVAPAPVLIIRGQ